MKFIPKSFLVLLIALPILAAGMLYYAFHAEDYSTQAGSIDFYLKISSIIRKAPLIDAATVPTYSGSVGDGTKQPHSRLTYFTREANREVLNAQFATYLQQNQFSLVSSSQIPHQPADLIDRTTLNEATFIKGNGSESIDLRINRVTDKNDLEIDFTHFE